MVLLSKDSEWRKYPIAIFVSIFAGFGSFLLGYDAGVMSGIFDMKYFQEKYGFIQIDGKYEISPTDKSLTISMLFIGGFFGSSFAQPCDDFFGRRWGIITGCIIFIIGVICELISWTMFIFIIGRIIAGVGLGLTTCVVLMYQSECSPKTIRGAIVSTYQWFITIGLLLSAIIVNGTKDIHSNACFNIPIGLQIIWATILIIGIYFSPESPRYLVSKGSIDKAYESQAKLISSKSDDLQVKSDINELITNIELLKKYESYDFCDCFKMGPQKNLLRTLVGILITLIQQFCGINFICYYGTRYLFILGISKPFIIIIIIQSVNVLLTIPGILLMDKIGRRYMLIIGAIGMAICEYVIAIVGITIGQTNETLQHIFIIFSCLFIAFFAVTWGPTPWVIISEIFPISIQAQCISLSIGLSWLYSFAVNYSTPYMVVHDHGNLKTNIFFIWGSISLVGLFFSIFCIWETKQLSFEQIDYLIRNSSPIKSIKLNKKLRTNALIENDISYNNNNNTIPNLMGKNFNSTDKISTISMDMDKPNEKTFLLKE